MLDTPEQTPTLPPAAAPAEAPANALPGVTEPTTADPNVAIKQGYEQRAAEDLSPEHRAALRGLEQRAATSGSEMDEPAIAAARAVIDGHYRQRV